MFPSPTIECFIWKSFLATSISSRIRIRYLSPFHRHCLATPHDVINFRIVKDGTTKKTHKIFLILLRLRYRVVIFFCLLFICVLILNALRVCSLQHCCWAFSSHTILIPILKRRHSDKREATWRLWRRSSNIRWKGHSKCFPMAILWWDKKNHGWLLNGFVCICVCVLGARKNYIVMWTNWVNFLPLCWCHSRKSFSTHIYFWSTKNEIYILSIPSLSIQCMALASVQIALNWQSRYSACGRDRRRCAEPLTHRIRSIVKLNGQITVTCEN